MRAVGSTGSVLEVRSDGRALVAVGGLKLTVSLDQLGRAPDSPKSKAKSTARKSPPARAAETAQDDLIGPPQTPEVTLDLRGFRRDEVQDALEAFLDRLYGNNTDAGWVIHGHGTGAIRDEVRQLVRLSPYVRDSRPGRRGEGGDGITLVWLSED